MVMWHPPKRKIIAVNTLMKKAGNDSLVDLFHQLQALGFDVAIVGP
jgi:hypothetical protein